MGIEIRACRDAEEMAAYRSIVNYVFAQNDGDQAGEEQSHTLPEWTTCAFADGRLVTTMGTFPFTVRLNGAGVPMGGVTAVGTYPEMRRQGLLRQVMQAGLATMRERGQPFAILWASMAAIYQRFGYGLAASQASYDFDPRYAQFQEPGEYAGKVTTCLATDALAEMKRIYVAYATPRNLLIHRAMPLWQLGPLQPESKGAPVYAAVYRDAAGEPRGYAVYATRHEPGHDAPGPDQVMTVKDFFALDMDAYRALWEHLCRHDLVGRIVIRNRLPVDDPAPDLLLEPRNLQRSTSDAIWLRVVDIERGLPLRPYGTRGELTFRIAGDLLCPWNEGTWLLETDGATTEVRRVSRAPELTMRPNELASLVSGRRSATLLARAGRIEAAKASALPIADALFRTEYAPFCPNGF